MLSKTAPLNDRLALEFANNALPADLRPSAWISDELREAIETSWQATWSLLFDEPDKPLVGRLARHHRDAIKWHWASRHRLCRQQVRERVLREQLSAADLTDGQRASIERKWREKQPRYLADFPMWSRGHMKSTVARRVAVVDAVISLYYGLGGYCLYFSGTDKKTEKHAISIDRLLKSPRIRQHAPALGQVMREDEREKDKAGRSMGWKATFFYTAANYIFHFGSLQSGLAGGNIDDIRPTLIIPDDIDDRKDSAVVSETNFNLLTTEILPMGAQGTLTFWAQNLISRFSAMYRIYKGHARVLTDRRPSKPVPAIIKSTLRLELRAIKGIVRDVILPGAVATWPWFDIAACQAEINRMGLPAFLRECQHEVEQSTEGLMIHTYDDLVHPISISEFASRYGEKRMPVSWPKEWGNDWARTKTAKHANVAMWRTVSSQNSPLPGFTFYFHPMSFRANAQPEDVAERVLSCLNPYAVEPRNSRLNPVVERLEQKAMTWSDLRRDELTRANALEHAETQLDRIEYERNVLQEIIPQYSEPVLRLHNVVGGVNSHEREDIRLIYNDVYALKCEARNPGKFGGVEQLNRDFAVDYQLDHPFRAGVKGYSRTFIVVPDDLDAEPRLIEAEINGKKTVVTVYPPHAYPDDLSPEDLHDDKLLRYQLRNWRTVEAKITETGERIDEPLKMNDDFGNLAQMFAVAGALPNIPLTPQEEFTMLVEAKMPELAQAETEVVVVDKQMQQQIEAVKMSARVQVAEKYGEDVIGEEEEERFFGVEEDEEDDWWD